MEPDYKNWVPEGMITGFAAGAAGCGAMAGRCAYAHGKFSYDGERRQRRVHEVRMIGTANGLFMSRAEAAKLFLTGSAVLTGKK